MRQHPQPDCYKTTHKFANGMYCRTFWMPAGHLVTGAKQRHEHIVMVLRGETLIYTEEGGTVALNAGDVSVSPAGARRAVYSVTDAELMTIHRLPDPDERNLEKVWNALVDAEGMPRLYDANNRLRDLALPGASVEQLQ
jgi:uncharacterized cupin superfamily protein